MTINVAVASRVVMTQITARAYIDLLCPLIFINYKFSRIDRCYNFGIGPIMTRFFDIIVDNVY